MIYSNVFIDWLVELIKDNNRLIIIMIAVLGLIISLIVQNKSLTKLKESRKRDSKTGAYTRGVFQSDYEVGKDYVYISLSPSEDSLISRKETDYINRLSLLIHEIGDEVTKKIYRVSRYSYVLILPTKENDEANTPSLVYKQLSRIVGKYLINNRLAVYYHGDSQYKLEDYMSIVEYIRLQMKESGEKIKVYNENTKEELDIIIEFQKALQDNTAKNKIKALYRPILDIKEGKHMGYEVVPSYCSGTSCVEINRHTIRFWDISVRERLSRTIFESAIEYYGDLVKLTGSDVVLIFKMSKFAVTGTPCDFYLEKIRQYGIKPQNIVFGIREESALGKTEIAAVEEYKKAGFEFALTNFSLGNNSLRNTNTLKSKIIVFNESLLSYATDEEKDGIITCLSDLRGVLYDSIVISGINTKELYDYIIKRDIRYIKGDYVSKAISEYDIKYMTSRL